MTNLRSTCLFGAVFWRWGRPEGPICATGLWRGTRKRDRRRGSALLMVLWLSLALSAIVFTLSRTVRTEFDRAALNVDSTKAYFLAQGAIEAALMRIGEERAGGESQGFQPGQRFLRYSFPSGDVEVEVTAESGKLSLLQATPESLTRLLVASGIQAPEAMDLAARITEYRKSGNQQPARANEISPGRSSFQGARASFKQLEDLLMVPGLSRDILYGTYARDGQGRLVRTGGIYRNLTLKPAGVVNLNYASREMMLAAGLSASEIDTIEQIRSQRPLRKDDPGVARLLEQSGEFRAGLGGSLEAYTLRATARLKDGRAVRSVAALAEKDSIPSEFRMNVVRWYDNGF